MLKQATIDYIYKSHKYPKKEKELIKSIVNEVFNKHYLKSPENLEDALLDFLGTIEISIKFVKKEYKIKDIIKKSTQ